MNQPTFTVLIEINQSAIWAYSFRVPTEIETIDMIDDVEVID